VAVVEALQVQLAPLEKIPRLEGVEGVQLVDARVAADVERQWCCALQVDGQFAAE